MTPQRTDPNYKPIQFTASQIRERYERKRQQEEHERKINAGRLAFREQCLKALNHEAIQAEQPQGYNYNHD